MKAKYTPIKDFIKGTKSVAETLSETENIEIIGNGRIIIEEVKKIVEYREDTVTLIAGRRTVSVSGKSLELNNYGDKTLVVDGEIFGVRFGSL